MKTWQTWQTWFRFDARLVVTLALSLLAFPAAGSDLAYFGFVGVECSFDDPLDDDPLNHYSAEVAAFTNIAHVCAGDTIQATTKRLDRAAIHGLGAMLDVSPLFFEASGIPAPSGGEGFRLRSDARALWLQWSRGLGLDRRGDTLAAIYLVDEPVWNGISAEDLAQAARWVKEVLPRTPILIVEAYPVIDLLQVPTEVDWIGFDRYGVGDPGEDPDYLADLARLQARRSRPDQKIAIIMESQWLPIYGSIGVGPDFLAGIAANYFALALATPDTVALIGYLWPGGLDDRGQLGARELPAVVQQTYRQIGEAVLGARNRSRLGAKSSPGASLDGSATNFLDHSPSGSLEGVLSIDEMVLDGLGDHRQPPQNP